MIFAAICIHSDFCTNQTQDGLSTKRVQNNVSNKKGNMPFITIQVTAVTAPQHFNLNKYDFELTWTLVVSLKACRDRNMQNIS